MNAQSMPALAALYAAPANDLAHQLPDVGDGIAAACAELARHPTPVGAEHLATRLQGAARLAMRLREALIREATHAEP